MISASEPPRDTAGPAPPRRSLERALDEVEAGDPNAVAVAAELVAACEDVGARRGFGLALDAAAAFAGIARRTPIPADVEGTPPDSAGATGVARARRTCELRALLSWDVPVLHAWAVAPAFRSSFAPMWSAALDGTAPPVREGAPDVLEALAAAALAELSVGRTAEGLLHARRAARLGVSLGERGRLGLAHLLLARARRHAGRPHLAARITTGLCSALPAPWAGWLAWEALLAGARPAIPQDGDTVALRAARTLSALLTAADLRAQAAFDAAALALQDVVVGVRPFAQEAAHVVALLDARRPPTAEVLAWRRGETAAPPCGLHAVCAGLGLAPRSAWAHVWAPVDAPGIREARAGLSSHIPGDDALPDDADAPAADAAHVRTATALAALALAGPAGLPLNDFFATVYGFTYRSRLHQQTVDGLVYRAKRALGGRGEIDRSEGQIRLQLSQPLSIPDPRCAESTEDAIVRTLGQEGPKDARALAASLGLPLRTVQAALHMLVDDGACASARSGRAIVYHLEDTSLAMRPV